MTRLFALLFALNISTLSAAADPAPAELIPVPPAPTYDDLLDIDKNGTVHGVILPGKEPFARNESVMFRPASTVKVLVALTALEKLGPEHKFVTLLRWQQNKNGVAANVTLIGGGDPTWGMKEFNDTVSDRLKALLAPLEAAGVKEVQGPITLESSDARLEDRSIPGGWQEGDLSECTAGLGLAWNLDANCAKFTVNALDQGAFEFAGVPVQVELRLTAGEKTNLINKISGSPDGAHSFGLEGTFLAGTPKSTTFPLFDTKAYLTALLEKELVAKGLRRPADPLPPEPSFWGFPWSWQRQEAKFESPPLKEILKPMLKNSVNFLADAILKAIGLASSRDQNLRESGLAEVQAYIARNGDGNPFYVLADGSGLSQQNRFSPRGMLKILESAKEKPFFPVLWDALSISGQDGTLKNRFKGSVAEGKLRGKTGTLSGAYSLVGYLVANGEALPFVQFNEAPRETGILTRKATDAALLKWAVAQELPPLPPAYLGNAVNKSRTPYVRAHDGEARVR